MFAFMGQPPSQEQIDKFHMEHEESLNSMLQMFDRFTADEIEKVMDLLAACKDDPYTAGFWVGQLGAIQRAKKFDEAAGQVMIPNSQPGERIQVPDPELGESGPKWVQGMLDLDQAEAGTSAENVEKNMELYGVKVESPLTDNPAVRCLNCGTVFQSLEDRMLSQPGANGCHGCREKAMWG